MTKIKTWKCVDNCGACCKLQPEERIEALTSLGPVDQDLFLSLVSSDGWCRYFDKSTRRCTIYEERPGFCNIRNISGLFKISPEIQNDFAIQCCKQHIKSIYGGRSKEMKRFVRSIS